MAPQISPKNEAVRGSEKSFSLLKKSELLIIFIAALLVTLTVFFVFFRTPENTSSQHDEIPDQISQIQEKLNGLESKMDQMGTELPEDGRQNNNTKGLLLLQQKTTRLESGIMLKIDALILRLDDMEKRIRALENKADELSSKPLASIPPKPEAAAKITKTTPGETGTKELTKKPAMQKTKKQEPMFHTVKKGETLWSISQKYKIPVEKLRELNNLSKDSKIYPGINMLVR